MRGGRHLRPLRVLETASRMLETNLILEEPAWYRAVAANPPTTTLIRTFPVRHANGRKPNPKRKPANLYKPQQIVYKEDALRSQFFKHHPWELARPRVLVENDGRDQQRYDWSKLQQRGKAVDGESVVQRQMWLMENEKLSQTQAYDKARKEFYDVRMKEDIERRVALEEAKAVGATFGKTYWDLGVELEGQVLEKWKEQASQLAILKKGRIAAMTGESLDEVEAPAAVGEPAAEEATVAA